ncbi:MAG: DEAD/DEAH box helicase, partial [Myxococcaceae bacterium]
MNDNVEETPGEGAQRPAEYVADVSFQDLKLSPEVLRALSERGYTNPTPVQAKAFQPAFEGRDLIVRSKTGTGKTAAFGLPLLERIKGTDRVVKALILCPTRELALQVAAELQDLGKYKGIKVATIYGGASMKVQEDALEAGSQIVVGTPGRVFDHIRRKNLKLENCSHAVLDEADEMLNQGFFEEVTRILDYLPKDRQVLLFSATVPPDIQSLISKYTKEPETLLLSGDQLTVDHIHHIVYEMNENLPKPRQLVHILEANEPENAIIFCNTRDDTTLVSAVLNRNGFDTEVLNGDLPQKERERVMGRVKRGELAFMVATDIAARGIDISGLQYVVNYSLPEDAAVYLHRVGRTGRIGNKGTAINVLSGRELMTFKTLQQKYGINFERRPLPSADEAMQKWTERHIKEIQDGASGAVFEGMLPLAASVKARNDSDDLIAFLLRYFFTHHRIEKVQAKEETPASSSQEERPRREERPRERGPKREGSREGGRDRGGRERRDARGPRPETPTSTVEETDTDTKPAEGVVDSNAETPSAGTPAAKPARRERPPREAPRPLPEGHVRLWINIGRQDKVNAESLPQLLEAAGAPAGKISHVEVRGNFS